MSEKWNSETSIRFIQKFKQYECLWNMKHVSYKNKHVRDASFQNIVDGMDIPDFNIAAAKNKMRNLKSTYYQEKKKIARSKSSGSSSDNVYVPNIKWFNEMHALLKNANESRNNVDNECIDDSKGSMESNISFIRPQPKKLKSSTTTMSQQNELLSLACGYLSKQDNKQDSDLDLAKVWANKLKSLDPNQRLFAEKAINDILFEAQLGTLNRNSVQINENYSCSSTPLSVTCYSDC